MPNESTVNDGRRRSSPAFAIASAPEQPQFSGGRVPAHQTLPPVHHGRTAADLAAKLAR